MTMGRLLLLPSLAMFALLPRESRAQGAPPPPAATGQDQPGYRLSTQTRIVVEDVTVTDGKGAPVAALPRTAFHLFDDEHAQEILSFDETDAANVAPAAVARGELSNAALYRNGGVLTVLLIDPIGMELGDQMYLRLQMLQYVRKLPEGAMVAVFRSTSRGTPVLLQSATADRGLLRDAIDSSVPTMTRPVSRVYNNAVSELHNLADYLRPVPGRKSLLWFAGKFPLYRQPTNGIATGEVDRNEEARETREAYRALEQARIAVYPIDVRGVVIANIGYNPAGDVAQMSNDPSTGPKANVGDAQQTGASYNAMDQLASATGGVAFYSKNDLAGAMGSALQLEEHGYLLAYRPTPYAEDASWHRVRLAVDGRYQVHYRTGYYALSGAAPAPGSRRPMGGTGAGMAEVQAPGAEEEGDLAKPLIFEARLKQDGGSAKKPGFLISYLIPSSELQYRTAADGTSHTRYRVAAVAYNTNGDILSSGQEMIETHYTPAQMEIARRLGTPARQQIDLPRGADYLLLAVQEMATGRVGTVQVTRKSAEAVSRP